MKKYQKITLFALLTSFVLIGCNLISSPFKGHFSKRYSDVADAQTDDERTLVGEYNDYLKLVDSLAAVWDSDDTLTMRRLYYNQRNQIDFINKAKKHQNIRHSLLEIVENNVDCIRLEISQRLSPELGYELYHFHEAFDLNESTNLAHFDFKDVVDGKIYSNSYGEHYFLRKHTIYNYKGKNTWHEKIECVIRRPIKEKQIEEFLQKYQTYQKRYNKPRAESYKVGDGNPMQEIELPDEAFAYNAVKDSKTNDTDWDATEIDWCEECANKGYSCCPKCKGGEKADCKCGCKGCHDMWEYHNL